MVSIFFLYRSSQSELAPQEDQGFVLVQATYAPDATLQRKESVRRTGIRHRPRTEGGARRYFKSMRPARRSSAWR